MPAARHRASTLRFTLLALLAPATARAVEPSIPSGAGTGLDHVSKGVTNVATGKFQAIDRKAVDETKDVTELSLSAGSMTAAGNAHSQAATLASKFRLRRDSDQVMLAAAGNYARSALADGEYQTTVQNLQGLERYDRFVGDVALLVAAQQRSDRFQGIDLRAQFDPGLGYYFLNAQAQLLWVELGYDALYDIRREDARLQPDGSLLDKTRTLHSARAFVGYDQELGSASRITTGMELLQGVSELAAQRLNFDVVLTARVVGSLSIGVSLSEKFDSRPLPGKRNNDLVTAVSLVYTILDKRHEAEP